MFDFADRDFAFDGGHLQIARYTVDIQIFKVFNMNLMEISYTSSASLDMDDEKFSVSIMHTIFFFLTISKSFSRDCLSMISLMF